MTENTMGILIHKQPKQWLYELAYMLQPKLSVLKQKSSPKLFLQNQNSQEEDWEN